MTNEDRGIIRDVECAVLNEDWVRQQQDVMKAMGANPADLRSPNFKVQILRFGTGVKDNWVYCAHRSKDSLGCELINKGCIYHID